MNNTSSEQSKLSFITIDDKIVNENCIRWAKKMDDCIHICMKSNGCSGFGDTYRVCKLSNPVSYAKLNKYFAVE